MKEKVAIICPGRGSYTKETLGYLKNRSLKVQEMVHELDQLRKSRGEITITELDNAKNFDSKLHMIGENASILIAACAYADFLELNLEKFEVEVVTGNSMGWYIALMVAGVLDLQSGFEVINSMGSMMKENLIGGQIIYPVVNENWEPDQQAEEMLFKLLSDNIGHAYPSIHLGGFEVIGGDSVGLNHLLKNLPKKDIYPFKLVGHGAFHTPLLLEISERAFNELPINLFKSPKKHLVDGSGRIWSPYSTSLNEIYEYTFNTQVVETYDFTLAVTLTMKEFCPDKLVLLGPGSGLGGATGQIMIKNDWQYLKNKSTFIQMQNQNPYLLAFGHPEQKKILLA